MNKTWTDNGWNEYMYWHDQSDKRTIKKINKLIQAIDRHPYVGPGKPEPLKYELSGKWSRRIDQENRLIYSVNNDVLTIFSCRTHYR
ncbi:Txe/YoeB family addiction module toxin [Lacticaseibacillus zeae]|uniref:Endoribonuclease YoeB n=1 Tax=Lacticaseibacillus zeae TaxID=57037 RepID=A0A5R8LNW3_LACZE|nr:Txe/YoeB family addiction module toxin [Lacticaseibacillus zeae]TLF38919.1 Txe/YoeB family addiction module toxin [Lacticaseibacillus zeae]